MVYLLLASICSVLAVEEARKPKLFYVSTTTTTSTEYQSTVCFVSSDSATLLACTRKRRSLTSRDSGHLGPQAHIQPLSAR